ncbi:MAG: hypothetical protein V9H69_04255 [Anaerolineae bacterium]
MPPHPFIQQMPKVELHIHLEGAIREPATLLRLAERNRVALPADTVEGLRAGYTFSDFEHFVQIYMAIQQCLRSADDFSPVAYELGVDMARQNIRYREGHGHALHAPAPGQGVGRRGDHRRAGGWPAAGAGAILRRGGCAGYWTFTATCRCPTQLEV